MQSSLLWRLAGVVQLIGDQTESWLHSGRSLCTWVTDKNEPIGLQKFHAEQVSYIRKNVVVGTSEKSMDGCFIKSIDAGRCQHLVPQAREGRRFHDHLRFLAPPGILYHDAHTN